MSIDRVLSILTIFGGAALIAYVATAHSKNSYVLIGLLIAIAVVGAVRWYRKPPERPLRAFVILGATAIIAMVLVMVFTAHSVNDSLSSTPNTDNSHANYSSIDGQFPADTKVINADYPAKTCVNLYGTQDSAVVSKVGCGSPDNNFIVVQQVKNPAECVGDVDQKYYTNTVSGEYTLCLDYYWVQDSCFGMNGFDIKRVNCADKTQMKREKPIKLELNTASASDCPDGGFAHPVRRFTICTQTQHP